MDTIVYLINADQVNTSGYDIDNWMLYDKHHPEAEMTEDAKDFVRHVLDYGKVYSLDEFCNAYNLEEFSYDTWIYITNKKVDNS